MNCHRPTSGSALCAERHLRNTRERTRDCNSRRTPVEEYLSACHYVPLSLSISMIQPIIVLGSVRPKVASKSVYSDRLEREQGSTAKVQPYYGDTPVRKRQRNINGN